VVLQLKEDTEVEEEIKVEAWVPDLKDNNMQNQVGLTMNRKRNPYFALGYAACTYHKQKYAFLQLAGVTVYTFGLFVCVPIILSRSNIFDELELDFSIALKIPCSGLASLYFLELLWIGMDNVLRVLHHFGAIFCAYCVLLESTTIPPVFVFIRGSCLALSEGPRDSMSLCYRFNIGDPLCTQTFRFYYYIVASVITFVLEWLYIVSLYDRGDQKHFLIILVSIYEAADVFHIYKLYGLVKNLPKTIVAKQQREISFLGSTIFDI